jgi:tetratricopeptide (TPR) repeat protein
MLGKLIKKIIGRPEKPKENGGAKLALQLREKSEKFSQFLGEQFQLAQEEISIVRKKCKNLRETNYLLGLKHLENGRLTDAIFRFRIIKKFWPDLFDAYYQLAYCLILKNKPQKAKEVLEELLSKKPDYGQAASDLLNHINSSFDA